MVLLDMRFALVESEPSDAKGNVEARFCRPVLRLAVRLLFDPRLRLSAREMSKDMRDRELDSTGVVRALVQVIVKGAKLLVPTSEPSNGGCLDL